jgi:hypothetical protein
MSVAFIVRVLCIRTVYRTAIVCCHTAHKHAAAPTVKHPAKGILMSALVSHLALVGFFALPRSLK